MNDIRSEVMIKGYDSALFESSGFLGSGRWQQGMTTNSALLRIKSLVSIALASPRTLIIAWKISSNVG